MKLPANHTFIFDETLAGTSFGVPATQLLHFPQQLEHIVIHAELKRVFEVQIFALPNLPLDAPTTLALGQPVIALESQSRLITADEHIIEFFPRIVFNMNPMCLVVYVENISQQESTISVIIESHDWFKPSDDKLISDEFIKEKLIRPMVPLPSKILDPGTVITPQMCSLWTEILVILGLRKKEDWYTEKAKDAIDDLDVVTTVEEDNFRRFIERIKGEGASDSEVQRLKNWWLEHVVGD